MSFSGEDIMKQIVVPFGGAVGVQGNTLFPAILKECCIDILVVLENIEFVVLFHTGLHSAARWQHVLWCVYFDYWDTRLMTHTATIYQNDNTLNKKCTYISFWYIMIFLVHRKSFG